MSSSTVSSQSLSVTSQAWQARVTPVVVVIAVCAVGDVARGRSRWTLETAGLVLVTVMVEVVVSVSNPSSTVRRSSRLRRRRSRSCPG